MSVENATMAAIVLIIMALGARILTTTLLAGRKKEISKITAALRGARAELEFAKERTKAAESVISFSERQKRDLIEQIGYTREDLKILEAEAEAEAEPKEPGERPDPKLPRHLREMDS